MTAGAAMIPMSAIALPARHPDAALIAVCGAFRDWNDRFRRAAATSGHDLTPANYDFARAEELLDEMFRLQAVTAEGVLARLHAFISSAPDFSAECEGGWDGQQLKALFRDATAFDPALTSMAKEA
ncbi:MAG TPA: hypothetical protein VGC09_00595 [Rhodopila sp.]